MWFGHRAPAENLIGKCNRFELFDVSNKKRRITYSFIKMKKIYLLLLPVLFAIACKKDDVLPLSETVTKGSKWNLRIGSLPADVYSQLQQLGLEKNFADVAVVYRQPSSKPEEVQGRLSFYRAVTLQKNSVYTERVLIQFRQDRVSSIQAGGAMLDSVSKWPQDTPDETTIHKDDPVDNMYAKLLAIYKTPAYGNYQIILPDKSLEKPFDPDMANYDQWSFAFSTDVKPGKRGTSFVALYFSSGKLSKIRHTYTEATVYN